MQICRFLKNKENILKNERLLILHCFFQPFPPLNLLGKGKLRVEGKGKDTYLVSSKGGIGIYICSGNTLLRVSVLPSLQQKLCSQQTQVQTSASDMSLQGHVSPTSTQKALLWKLNSQSWTSLHLTSRTSLRYSRCPVAQISSLRHVTVFQFSHLLTLAQMVLVKYFWVLFIDWLFPGLSLWSSEEKNKTRISPTLIVGWQQTQKVPALSKVFI